MNIISISLLLETESVLCFLKLNFNQNNVPKHFKNILKTAV